jgi:glycosyltransferase involved in cell wall biosynthesis
MNILFVAPFPPPLTGNSLPIKILYDSLGSTNIVERIDLSKKNHKPGIDSFGRILEIVVVILKFAFKAQKKDLIYISVSESKAGNIRDLFLYFLSIRKLDRVYIHMLGGAGMSEILKNRSLIFKLNKFFVSRVGGVIVEGQVQKDMFTKLIDHSKIKIAPNFAQELLFSSEVAIHTKFLNITQFRILFLSNMLPGKGHQELFQAYMQLDSSIKKNIRIDFAGKIVEKDWENMFLSEVKKNPNLFYHGSVDFDTKKKLFDASHIFCLPTYYKYEGQPFTIIEAYATGNVVVTTNHSGISNIFNVQNGYEVEKQSVDEIKVFLSSLVKLQPNFEKIALNNFHSAKKQFTQVNFIENVRNFINC